MLLLGMSAGVKPLQRHDATPHGSPLKHPSEKATKTSELMLESRQTLLSVRGLAEVLMVT